MKRYSAALASLICLNLVFNGPGTAHAAALLSDPALGQPAIAPSAVNTTSTGNTPPPNTTTNFLAKSSTLSAAEAPCTAAMCGVESGQTVSGTILVQPNLSLNPDVKKVSYYLNGTLSSREYASPFTWGGSAGFDTTKIKDGNYTLSGAYTTKTGDNSFTIAFTVKNAGTTPDTTAPVISGAAATNVTAGGAAINWTTDEVSDSQVEYRVQGTTAWTATPVNAALTTNHSVTLSGLSANTTYQYQVKSKDTAGNLATQPTIATFATPDSAPAGQDFVGVTSGVTVRGVVNIGPNLTTHPGIKKVAYYVDGKQSGKVYKSPFYWGGLNGDGTAGFDTTTLPDGNHTLLMGYTDTTGDHSVTISFKVNNTADGAVAPVVSGVDSWGVNSSQATIVWTTNEPSDSQVEYRVQGTEAWSAAPLKTSFELNHWIVVNGLTASTVYEYRVKSRDTDSNLTTQANLSSFTTKAPTGDTTPPKISNVTSSNITSTSATVNWFTDEASDSRVRYRAQGANTAWIISGLNPSMGTGHAVDISGLTASTVYEVQTFSQDASGNLVAQETVSLVRTADLTSSAKLIGINDGDTLTGIVKIGPDLSAFGPIQKVVYYVDGINKGNSLSSPFTWGGPDGFGTRVLTNTPHTFKAVITDNTGNHEINLNFTAYNTDIPPNTEFTGIQPGATVSGVVNISVDLAKHPDVRKVQYYVDFAQSGKVYISPFLWGGTSGDGTVGFDTHGLSNNPHMLIMFYTDKTGDHEGRIDFIVNNV